RSLPTKKYSVHDTHSFFRCDLGQRPPFAIRASPTLVPTAEPAKPCTGIGGTRERQSLPWYPGVSFCTAPPRICRISQRQDSRLLSGHELRALLRSVAQWRGRLKRGRLPAKETDAGFLGPCSTRPESHV